MKFDLSWFKTIPGLLITFGVVLLIVALIIFIVTSSKNKKEKKEKENNENKENVNSEVPQDLSATPVDISAPTVDTLAAVTTDEAIPVPVEVGVSSEDAIPVPVEVTPTPVSVEPTPAPIEVLSTPVEVTPVEVTPSVEPLPVVDTSASVQVAPVDMTVSATIPTVQDVVPTVEVDTPSVLPQPAAQPSIYGGVSQIIPNIEINQSNHQIYGGADPLENTQSINVVPEVQPAADTQAVVPPVPTAAEVIPQQSSMDGIIPPQV